MKFKYVFLFAFIFLLCFSINVSADSGTPDFVNGTLTTLSVNSSLYNTTQNLRVQYYERSADDKYWFVGYSSKEISNTYHFIARYDDSFNKEYGYHQIPTIWTGGTSILASDFQVGFPDDDTLFLRQVYTETGTTLSRETYRKYYLNLTEYSSSSGSNWGTYATNMITVISNDWNYILFQTSPTKLLTLTFDNDDPDKISGMNNESLTHTLNLTWPSEATSPANLDIAYSQKWNTYIVVYESAEDGNREIFANYYDSTTLNYLGREEIATNSTHGLYYPQLMLKDNDWYLTYYTNDTYHRVFIDILDYVANNDMEKVAGTSFVPKNVGTGNNTITPTLAFDTTFLYLFYMVQNSSNTTQTPYGIYVLSENYTCSCSGWTNTSCVGDYRKQIRDCNYGSICNETTYFYDSTCATDYVTKEGGRSITDNKSHKEIIYLFFFVFL
jgi:hypothetical protein